MVAGNRVMRQSLFAVEPLVLLERASSPARRRPHALPLVAYALAATAPLVALALSLVLLK